MPLLLMTSISGPVRPSKSRASTFSSPDFGDPRIIQASPPHERRKEQRRDQADLQQALPSAIAAFRQSHGLVQIGVKVLTPADALERVANGEADLGLVFGPVETSLVDTHMLRMVPMICALPAAHRLAGQASISASDLPGECLITTTERPLWGNCWRTLSRRPALRWISRSSARSPMSDLGWPRQK
jgi:DNA-binding transcriptional LysR family regulator